MIEIKRKAYNKMYAYCKSSKTGELGGLILGTVENNGDITVENVILMEQVRTGTTFEISETALMDFTKQSSAKTLTKILGWWHSHINFGCFWSAIDDDCFDRIRGLSNFCLGIVVSIPKTAINDEMDIVCRLDLTDFNKRKISMNEVEYQLEAQAIDYIFNFGKIKEEIKTKVKEDNRLWKPCPFCKGSGTILDKRKKKLQGVDDYSPYMGYGYLDDNNSQTAQKETWRDLYGY